MTSAAALATAQQERSARLGRSVVDRAAEVWALLDVADLSGSWSQLLPGLLQIVAAGQALAALQADAYVSTATQIDGPRINTSAFAGTAADGRSLESLLTLPIITTKWSIGQGMETDQALRRGLAQLLMLSHTEVADAGRLATGVGITARPEVRGSVRIVSLPACSRCIVLSGRVYRWSEGFQRHPRCDCTMAPITSRSGRVQGDPDELFARMSTSEQDQVFGRADAQAIRDGADVGQVVNARRGMYTAGGRSYTTEGTTRRGVAGKRLETAGANISRRRDGRYRRVSIPRLTPEQIYREAGDDRAEAIRLLERFGFII